MSSAKLPREPAEFGWLFGLEVGAYGSWTFGSWLGEVAGAVVVGALPLLAPALSFALPALFVALLVAMMRSDASRPVAGAVLAAGAVAAALYAAGLGSWSVPAAGVAGPAVGVMIVRRAGAG